MAPSQSPFGTPPPVPEVIDPPVGTPTTPRQLRTAASEPDHGRLLDAANEAPPDEVTEYSSPAAPIVAPLPSVRKRRKRNPSWMFMVACIISIALIAAGSVGAWFWWQDDATQPQAPSQGHESRPATGEELLASRDTDATPLSIAELFDTNAATAADGTKYPVVETQALDNCAAAATEKMAALLDGADCNQVVRATVTGPDGEYAATLGAVNLASKHDAANARDHIEAGTQGAFTTLRTSGKTDDLGSRPTVLGFNTYGHFLLYVVVGRVDGDAVSQNDPQPSKMVEDLADNFLSDRLAQRAKEISRN